MKTLPVFLGLLLVSGASAQQYVISTIAGGAPPPTPVAAVSATIGMPQGVATDAAGNVYFTSLNCVFKLDQSGEASRTQVRLGRSSVNTIEIVQGLKSGDQVVLSDMSAWDAFDRVRLR